jgi:hypothetical protein
MKRFIITEEEKRNILGLYRLTESDLTSSDEIMSFQDWMDKNHPRWIKDSDGRLKNLRQGPSDNPKLHVNGKGYGVFGPSTKEAWSKYESEYSKTKGDKSESYPYDKLKSNPSPQFIAEILKSSDGGVLGNDKESWAEAAFDAISSRSVYSKVAKYLGEDPYEFVESFIDTNETYHTKSIYSHYITLFPEKDKSGCSVKTLKASNWTDLYGSLIKRNMIKNGDPLIIVWGPTQTLYYTNNGKSSTLTTKVSTGVNGFGNTEDSKQTSSGLLSVAGKVRGKSYEVLVHKTPTGKILGPNVDSTRVDEDGKRHIAEVLTGILELSGLEGCNKNTFGRSIYIHGTNKEKSLGGKHSNGCIRVSNDVIKQLLNTVETGTKVYVYPG